MTTITLENAGICADCGLPAIGASVVERDGAERLICGQCVRLPRATRSRSEVVIPEFPWVQLVAAMFVAAVIVAMLEVWGPAK